MSSTSKQNHSNQDGILWYKIILSISIYVSLKVSEGVEFLPVFSNAILPVIDSYEQTQSSAMQLLYAIAIPTGLKPVLLKALLFYCPFLLVTCLSFGCRIGPASPERVADKIYLNGQIVTMTGPNDVREAIAIRNGIILATGEEAYIKRFKGSKTEIINLHGRTLMPGFINSYGNLLMAAENTNRANLFPPPTGTVGSINALLDAMKQHQGQLPDSIWVIGIGYDHALLKEQRHPNRNELDAAFPNTPAVVIHASGQTMVANSTALEAASVTAQTPDPPGGAIVKDAKGIPTGQLKGNARQLIAAVLPMTTVEERLLRLQSMLEQYAASGITTAQDGQTDSSGVELLLRAAQRLQLPIDVISIPDHRIMNEVFADSRIQFLSYRDRLKFGGIQVAVDGPPHWRAAFFTQPYLPSQPTHDPYFQGEPNLSQDQLANIARRIYQKGLPVYAHCYGDAAIDMFLQAHVANDLAFIGQDIRPVVVHSQGVRRDQLAYYRDFNIVPSFCSRPTFHWGDIHFQNLGKERATFLSPIPAADTLGIAYSLHNDYTVGSPDQLALLAAAANRRTRSGKVLGPNQRASVFQALKAITIHAAYQYDEEDRKGTLTSGKLADMVMLSDNPLRTPHEHLSDIRVVETIKEGKTIYRLGQNPSIAKH